jgi:hypothetical protein
MQISNFDSIAPRQKWRPPPNASDRPFGVKAPLRVGLGAVDVEAVGRRRSGAGRGWPRRGSTSPSGLGRQPSRRDLHLPRLVRRGTMCVGAV